MSTDTTDISTQGRHRDLYDDLVDTYAEDAEQLCRDALDILSIGVLTDHNFADVEKVCDALYAWYHRGVADEMRKHKAKPCKCITRAEQVEHHEQAEAVKAIAEGGAA